MWEMATDSMTMFLKGKLFKDIKMVFRQAAIGIAITVGILVGLSFTGLDTVFAAAVAGLVGGTLQPYLFKDLKYA